MDFASITYLPELTLSDEQETADVQNEFRTAVQSENRGAPASGAFEHVLQRRPGTLRFPCVWS